MLERVKAWIDERGRRLKEAAKAEDVAKRQRYALEWDEKEIRVLEVGIECRVKGRAQWGSIRKVIAFKRDLWNVDQVFVLVETDEGTLQLDEEFAGFWEFQADLQNHLPGALSAMEFWERVVSPAYETCLTTVYESKQT